MIPRANAAGARDRTPFEQDMLDQPQALAAFDLTQLAGVRDAFRREPSRIVITGMGSSHHAGHFLWRRLARAGRTAWCLDAVQVLDAPQLLSEGALVVVTSQSGASGEVVELLDRVRASGARLLGITADVDSPLARAADHVVELGSGSEATVSTKSYLNSLAAHRAIAAIALDEPLDTVRGERDRASRCIAEVLGSDGTVALTDSAASPGRRLAAIGEGGATATAGYAALIIKEAAKVPVQAYAGGEFRHGPFELAGPGLLALVFAEGPALGRSLTTLTADIVATGSDVVTIGATRPGATSLPAPGASALERLCTAAVVAQQIAVTLARAGGVAPGEFRYGRKITTTL